MTKTNQVGAVRTVQSRDSATSILRKLGVKARDYNFFIETNGYLFAVDVAGAQEHLKKLADNAAEAGVVRAPKVEEKTEEKAPAAKAVETKKPGRNSDPSNVSNTARTLIREGKTNAEVFAVLQENFGLDAKKSGYPAWYRHQMRKNGEKV
jgi:hypothetical protein